MNEILIEPGRGNLNAKAYVAAVVGPQRVVFGKRQVVSLSETVASQLVRNAGMQAQFAYVSVTLPPGAVGSKSAVFSASKTTNSASGLVAALAANFGPAAAVSFSTVIAPGEMLYASAAPGEGPFSVVVCTVWF